MITKKELIDFETDIADCYNKKKIAAPIHLYHGNEDVMLKIFKKVGFNDWVICSWRNHYQALCKGVPPDALKRKILKGRSMCTSFVDHRVLSSSIVGGTPSIAAGIAFGIAQQIKLIESKKWLVSAPSLKALKEQKVWCWVGDMSAETGAFHEAFKYSTNFNLPVVWIIESNGKSVSTPTGEAWGYDFSSILPVKKGTKYAEGPNWIYYTYKNDRYPHAGAGVRIKF
jgi:TPP-dependent pyruvate/acetoin dehydrogenase alpha subunit